MRASGAVAGALVRLAGALVRLAGAGGALALFLAGAARAGEKQIALEGTGLTVSVSSPWPQSLNRGWLPLFVRVENQGDAARLVGLHFQCGGAASDTIARAVRVEPGQTARLELCAPAMASRQNAYHLRVEAAGQRAWLTGTGAEQTGDAYEHDVLVVMRDAPLAELVARWTTALSGEGEARYEEATKGARATRHGTITGLGYPGPSAAAAKHEPIQATAVAHAELPHLADAYTSVHAVVLDTRGGLPAEPELAPILAYARTGGVVAVLGPDASAVVRRTPGLAAWAEDRFRSSASDGLTTYAMALGTLVVGDVDELLAGEAQIGALNAAIEARNRWRDPYLSAYEFDLAVPDIEVPYRPLTLLLVLFAILVGPVNLIVVRKLRRPALLLVTIPGTALVFSLGLFVYGALAQGLDVRAATDSVAVLDQRTHHGSSIERRTTFAGLAAGEGLRPGPGTVCLRPEKADWDWSNQREYVVEEDDGLLLSGAWMPVRTPTQHAVLVDRAARGRVEIARTPDGWTATNGLDTTILDLVFRDADGALHGFRGPILPGRSAHAEAEGPDAAALIRGGHETVLAARVVGGPPPRGTWCARVESSPLVDPLGVEYREVVSRHFVLGILDAAEGR